jgi:hypothetical protein
MKISALALAVLVAACSSRPAATPQRSLGPGERRVPTVNLTTPEGQQLLCAGGGFVEEVRLRGSPDDPRLVWMVDRDGARTDLAWPVGYSAPFTPDLELLDNSGRVVGRQGSLVVGGCETADPGVMWVDLENSPPAAT